MGRKKGGDMKEYPAKVKKKRREIEKIRNKQSQKSKLSTQEKKDKLIKKQYREKLKEIL